MQTYAIYSKTFNLLLLREDILKKNHKMRRLVKSILITSWYKGICCPPQIRVSYGLDGLFIRSQLLMFRHFEEGTWKGQSYCFPSLKEWVHSQGTKKSPLDQALCDGATQTSQAIKIASRSTGEKIVAFCLLSSVLKSWKVWLILALIYISVKKWAR